MVHRLRLPLRRSAGVGPAVTRRLLRAAWFVAVVGPAGPAACTTQAAWLSETPRGGTITYSIKDEGEVLSSPARRDALALIEEKCGKDYRIVREGRVARVNQRADRIWQGQITEEMVWAVQFTCS
jgi:hypothetical protein